MKMNRATAALVALEDAAPDVLFAHVPGTSLQLWPLMRWPLASAMASSEYATRLAPRVQSAGSKARRAVRALSRSSSSSRTLRQQADVLFVGSGGTVSRTPHGLRNVLFEDFAEALGDRGIVLQDAPILPGSAPTLSRTWSFDDTIVRTELAVRVAPHRTLAAATAHLARSITGHVDFAIEPDLMERAIRTTVARAQRASRIVTEFARVLDRVDPAIIVMEGAAYGDRSGQIAEAKRRGILVAELQHGWIGAAHAAYNFGAAARDGRLLVTLPDVLLTFGEFWGEGISVPYGTVPIGKPHLETAQATTVPLRQRERRVLIASNVSHPEETAAFVLEVRDTLPAGWRVTFRPHPQERSDVAGRYPSLLVADGVDIDDESDVYVSFARSRVVISGPSTVLYEALSLGCPVIVRRSAVTDYYLDPSVFTIAIGEREHPGPALQAVYEGTGADVDPALRERLWASGARQRFLAWESGVSASRRV
jgi:hypothetical protein